MFEDSYRKQDLVAHKKTLDKLVKLKRKISMSRHYQARVDFIMTLLQHYLIADLKQGGLAKAMLTERDFDTCFEMSDSDQVVGEIIKRTQSNHALVTAIKKQLGEGCYAAWHEHYINSTGYQRSLF